MSKKKQSLSFDTLFVNPANFHGQAIRKTDSNVYSPATLKAMSDRGGLNKAYSLPNRVFVDPNSHTMHIAGTSTYRDVYDDLKIPFNKTNDSWRYEVASRILEHDPTIETLTGHSLGASVALELQKNYPERDLRTVTYGAPVFDVIYNQDKSSKSERYRNQYDLISAFDQNAHTETNWPNPHSYSNFEHNHSEGKTHVPFDYMQNAPNISQS